MNMVAHRLRQALPALLLPLLPGLPAPLSAAPVAGKASLEQVLADLAGPDPGKRSSAAALAGRLKLSGAADALTGALSDPGPAVKMAAAAALARLKHQPARAPLVRLLAEGSPGLARAALRALTQLDRAAGKPRYLVVLSPCRPREGTAPAHVRALEAVLARQLSGRPALVLSAGEEEVLPEGALGRHLRQRRLEPILLIPALTSVEISNEPGQQQVNAEVNLLLATFPGKRMQQSFTGTARMVRKGRRLSAVNLAGLVEEVLDRAAGSTVDNLLKSIK